jgi:hypothetical protein
LWLVGLTRSSIATVLGCCVCLYKADRPSHTRGTCGWGTSGDARHQECSRGARLRPIWMGAAEPNRIRPEWRGARLCAFGAVQSASPVRLIRHTRGRRCFSPARPRLARSRRTERVRGGWRFAGRLLSAKAIARSPSIERLKSHPTSPFVGGITRVGSGATRAEPVSSGDRPLWIDQ